MLTLCALCALASPAATPGFDLAVAVGATRLAASNPTARPELVLLSDPRTGRRASFVVPAFGRVELRFALGSIDGLELRVLTRDETGMHVTSAWALDTLREAGECVWFDVDSHPFHAWGREAHSTRLLSSPQAPAGHLPSALCAPPPPAAHVPVITPQDARRRDAPPRLEKTPLPPV